MWTRSESVTSGSPHSVGDLPPPDNGPSNLPATVVACAVIAVVISGLSVAARFYTRGVLRKILGAEDWCILASWLFSFGNTVAMCFEAHHAVGRHIWTVAPENVALYFKDSWVTIIMYGLSLPLCKCSILLLYIRVLRFQYAYWACWIMLGATVVYGLFALAAAFTQCIPLQALWDPTITGAACHDTNWMYGIIAAHIASDFLVFMIPLPVVARMRLPLRQRIEMIIIFALGFFVCAISIIRFLAIESVIKSTDWTWDFTTTSIWTAVELNTAILVSCLIVLKPLFIKFWPGLFSSGQEPSFTLDVSPGRKDSEKSTSLASSEPIRGRMSYGLRGGDQDIELHGPWDEVEPRHTESPRRAQGPNDGI